MKSEAEKSAVMRPVIGSATEKFVQEILREVMSHQEARFSDVMVLCEQVIVATMLLNARQFSIENHVCVELIEAALHRATERFAELRHKEGKG